MQAKAAAAAAKESSQAQQAYEGRPEGDSPVQVQVQETHSNTNAANQGRGRPSQRQSSTVLGAWCFVLLQRAPEGSPGLESLCSNNGAKSTTASSICCHWLGCPPARVFWRRRSRR